MKTTSEKTTAKYAIVQYGYAVFGLGNTADEAKADAIKWLEKDGVQGGGDIEWLNSRLVDIQRAVDGDLVLVSRDPDQWKDLVEAAS